MAPVMAFGQHVVHQPLVDLRLVSVSTILLCTIWRQFALAGNVAHAQRGAMVLE
jgi:hypothetical protein